MNYWIDRVWEVFLAPLLQRALVFITPSDGLYYVYILTATVIGVAFFSWKNRTGNVIVAARDAVRAHRFSSRSTKDDIKLFIVDKIFLGFIYSFVMGSAFIFKSDVISLMAFIGLPTSHIVPGIFLSIILTVGSLLVFDFAVFIEHYLSHKILVLWEFHKIHHIAEDLNPLTAYRSHPVNQCCFIFIASFFSGTYAGVIGYFFDSRSAYLLFAGQNIFMFLLLLLGLNLQHSRVFLRYPPYVRKILVSPAYHQLHHSSDKAHHDINFGFIFSFWDALFKVQHLPLKHEELTFGVTGEKYENYAGIKKTYLTPFRRAYNRVLRKRKRRSVPG